MLRNLTEWILDNIVNNVFTKNHTYYDVIKLKYCRSSSRTHLDIITSLRSEFIVVAQTELSTSQAKLALKMYFWNS